MVIARWHGLPPRQPFSRAARFFDSLGADHSPGQLRIVIPFAVFSPALAAGTAVAAVGVPLLIHLLFRKRYQIVPWAAMRFLIVAERRHRRRIDQWLLLALRVLILILCLFAMIAATDWVEPLWQSIKPGATRTETRIPRTHHILVVDASLSMTAAAGEDPESPSRFSRAVVEARRLVDSSGSDDAFTVIVLAGAATTVVEGPAESKQAVVEALQELKPTHAAADTVAALTTIADVLARSPRREYPRRQVTFFTDLQRSAWINVLPKSDSPPPEAWQQVFGGADVDVAVVDVAHRGQDANLAIVDVALADPLPLVDTPITFNVTVANFGRTLKTDLTVQFLLGRPSSGPGDPIAIEEKRIGGIPPGDRVTIGFGADGLLRYREKGLHVIQVKIVSADALPADNERALAFQVREGLHALVVDGKTDSMPLLRAGEFLFRALFPPGSKRTDTPARPELTTPERFTTPVEFLDDAEKRPERWDCVYLCDVALHTPEFAAKLAAKVEAILRRGGAVVIGFGPNSTSPTSLALYNRFFFNDGNGPLPNRLGEVVSPAGPNDPGYRFAADEEAYRRPPLLLFQNTMVRPGLIVPGIRSYVRLDSSTEGRARQVLSFVSAQPSGQPTGRKPDPALIECNRHAGRVIVFTSSLNADWTDWPSYPSFLMFQHELLRFAVANPDRHTILIGDPLEEFYPPGAAGETAELAWGQTTTPIKLVLQDEAGLARFTGTRLSGLYKLRLGDYAERVFAVNVPEAAAGSGSESDLKRLEAAELRSLGTIQVVTDPTDVQPTSASGAEQHSSPTPHGPTIARFTVMVLLLVLALELFFAWRFGPSRAASTARSVERKFWLRLVSTLGALIPLTAAIILLGILAYYDRTGRFPAFLSIESLAEVPAAKPGEEPRWRLESLTSFVRDSVTDRRLLLALAAAAVVVTVTLYALERRAVAATRRLIVPMLLRATVFLLALYILLPQVRLKAYREGWPEIVILIDTSGSMGHIDQFKDPAVRSKAEQLAGTGLSQTNRLALAQLLLTRKDADWLDKLLNEKRVRVHIYAVDASEPRPVAVVETAAQGERARQALELLVRNAKGEPQPLGAESRLCEGVEKILHKWQGRPLAGIIMFTDGVDTTGRKLSSADQNAVERSVAEKAASAGVPLYLVGVGDAWETPDLELTDLQVEDTITVGDKLVFDARLAARGQVAPEPIAVTLSEKVNGQLVERGRTVVTPDGRGNRVPVTVSYTPMEPGEKAFVLEVPTIPGEVDRTNNRLERTILVTDSRRIRVLYVEGYPRHDFRFVKVLLERESERSAGGKGVEVDVVLLDASKGWPETDRSAFRGDFPTREQLFAYDVVILGDVDPKLFPRATRTMQDLVDFVKVKGGGMLFLSGESGTPWAYAETPLAEILPVAITSPDPARNPETAPLTEPFQPRITPAGRQHPLFRFSPDDKESVAIWARLKPLYWAAHGYRRKPAAVVLAVHPDRPAEGGTPNENHPLVLQQFVGAGPVLFLGFDDTWRWRFRNDEEQFDRFWIQAVRVLSRSRVRRVELRVLPKPEFRRDEKMTVLVRFPVEAPAPPPGSPVRVSLVRGPLPKPDGTPGVGPSEAATLTLVRSTGPGVQYEATLTNTPEGEYRFTLTHPEPQPGLSPATAIARVYPPLNELDRIELNKADLEAAAKQSKGGFYTLADAEKVLDRLENLPRPQSKHPNPPVEVWNSPWLYALMFLLISAEWLLRKRERLL